MPDLASYACDAAQSRGRLVDEPRSPTRTEFQRDRDRIVHSTGFRRLAHKTQVFVPLGGDHFRTRLTHTIEVAQIARALARGLRLDEDLAEGVALAHDLGHTPFGHVGEDALDALMRPFGGFDHNAQTLRILTSLERRYAAFDGLNLTWETLEGVVKHNGPLTGANAPGRPVPGPIAGYVRDHDLELETYPGLEAQVAALSDDIAYNNHDIDDGLRAGLFAIADLEPVPLVGPVFAGVAERYPGLEDSRLIGESIRRLIDRMVEDLVAETTARIDAARPASAEEVRGLGRPLAAFSAEMASHDRSLKAFLKARMYRHERVTARTDRAARVVRELFELFLSQPQHLPAEWRERAGGKDTTATARIIADYIAGMTDRFAFAEHRRLLDGPDDLYEPQ